MTLLSAAILLFLVIDAPGAVPIFIAALREVPLKRRRRIILREVCFAFLILCFFLFFGRFFLDLLHLSMPTLRLTGGIILFLISIKLIFPPPKGQLFGDVPAGEPMVFPLAVPLIAGPSASATVMVLASSATHHVSVWFLALLLACSLSAIILYFSDVLERVLGPRVLIAIERLMGLILAALAVEMIVQGISEVFALGVQAG